MERKSVSAIMLCLIMFSVFAFAASFQPTKAIETSRTPLPLANGNVVLYLLSGYSITYAAAVQVYPPGIAQPPSPSPTSIPGPGAIVGSAAAATVLPPLPLVALWDIKVVGTLGGTVIVRIYAATPVTQMWRTEFGAGDVNGDGKVNSADLCLLLKAFDSTVGSRTWNPYCDLNNDGKVNLKDLCILVQNFGRSSIWTWTEITTSSGSANGMYYVEGTTDHFSGFGVH